MNLGERSQLCLKVRDNLSSLCQLDNGMRLEKSALLFTFELDYCMGFT